MNRTFRLIVSGLISVIAVYFVYATIYTIKNSHTSEFFKSERYSWMFNDSVKKNIDTLFCAGQVRKSDVLYSYNISQKYFVNIWEFKELRIKDVQTIPLVRNVNLDNLQFTTAERFNVGYNTLITVKAKLPFKDFLSVNLNNRSNIIKLITAENYKGFYGTVNKVSLQNREGENLILFDYQEKNRPTLFLVCIVQSRFFVITFNSIPKIQFDESIINIFNLIN